MEAKNIYDRAKVIVVKVGEDDIDGMLITHDLNDSGQYEYAEKAFVDEVIKYLPEYAMGSNPIPTTTTGLIPYLRDAAKSVMKIKNIDEIKRLLDSDTPFEQWSPQAQNTYLTKGVFSELILHFLLREFKNTIPLISKIYFKDSYSHEAHGFDAVHVSDDGKMWLGETKFYSDGKQGICALVDDLNTHLKHDYLKEQFFIISRALDHSNQRREDWIQALTAATRLEEKLNMIIVPLLCIYEDAFANTIIDELNKQGDIETLCLEHFSSLKEYFVKKNDFPNRDRVQIVLMLLPVESKRRIVSDMLNRIYYMQQM